MKKKIKSFLPILALSLLPTLLLWLPFFLRLESLWTIPLSQEGMATIVANYDGPLYILVAKTLYNPDLVGSFSFTLPAEYYAAHFPLFPLLIKLLGVITGFPYAMLIITLISSVMATYFFSLLIRDFVKKENVLWLTFIFSIFPARWLIVRSVGSAEPLFTAAIIASLYYFRKKKYLYAGAWGAIAQFTKSPGILLFVAYGAAIFFPSFKKAAAKSLTTLLKHLQIKKIWPILLIPTALLMIFGLYKIQFNDFFAYFNSGDNIHVFFPPFRIFNYSAPWVGTFWLEEVIFVYLFGILGLLRLIKQKENALAWFVGIFFATTLFISHRDIIRYSLPIVPFLIASFSKVLTQRDFKIALALLIIPIYLFSIAYISQNVMPVSDWAPLL